MRQQHIPIRALHSVLLACVVLVAGRLHGQGLTVGEAVQRALRSPRSTRANAVVQEATGNVRQAGLGPNPRLYLQSEDLRPWADDFNFGSKTEDYGYVGQTFEVDGKRRKRVSVAQAKLREANANRALELRQLAASVTTSYWSAVELKRVADLLQDDLKAVDEMVDYHRKRVDAGAMRGVDLLRMQIERDRVKLTLDGAQREAVQARLELFKAMGTAPTDEPLTSDIEVPPMPLVVDLQTVLRQRPEIEAAQAAVDAAEADVALQKANGLPDPDVFAGYKRNNGDNTLYTSLQIPLPVRNRNQGEVDRARATLSAAQAALQVTRAQIQIEVQQAQANLAAQTRMVQQTLPDLRRHAAENLDLVSQAYRLGGVDLLRFIDAERTRFDVEVSAVRALSQLQQSAVQLQLASGVQP